MRTPLWLWALLGVVSMAAFGCDQLGLSKGETKAEAESKSKSDDTEDEDEDEDEDEEESDKDKKKKKKKADDDEEEEEEEDDEKDEEEAEDDEKDEEEASAEADAGAEEPDAGAVDELNAEVVRYGDKEQPQTGSITIQSAIFARVDANTTSKTVIVLQPGSVVTKEASFSGFFLVSWKTKKGQQLAWIEASKVFAKTPVTPSATATASQKPPPPPPPRPAIVKPGSNLTPGGAK
jgi:hypothetical protein